MPNQKRALYKYGQEKVFFSKNKSEETKRIDGIDGEGLNESNTKKRIEKDPKQQKLQSFESERFVCRMPNQTRPSFLSGKETVFFH